VTRQKPTYSRHPKQSKETIMSSNTIYIPYFYIIQHKETGKYYAGSKYAEDANPENFMVEGGYQTSSNNIESIIEAEGLDTFVIRKIRTFRTGQGAYNYETKFLQRINAAAHPLFYNGHNNDGYFDPVYRETRMLEVHGVKNFAQSPEFPIKFKETSQRKYGVDHHLQNPAIYQKRIDTCQERYGYDHEWQAPVIREKIFNTKLEKYGVGNFANPEKARETCLEKYGEDHFSKTEQGKQIHADLQKDRYSRDVIQEIKDLMAKAAQYEIDLTKDFGLTKFWWQRNDIDLEIIRRGLADELLIAEKEQRYRKTKKEKMKELNTRLYNRPIVQEIREKSAFSSVRLGPAWWRKKEDALQEILASM
jgi:hypothetical protein